MAKRTKRRNANGWKRDTAWHVYRNLRLSEALYLSFATPGIVSSGWRVMHDRDGKGFHPMVEFGNQRITLERAKLHVERNYDKLVAELEDKTAHYEQRKEERRARLAAKGLPPGPSR